MIACQMLVEHPTLGRGVTIPDQFDCCTPDETLVCFDGREFWEAVETASLTVLGPEKPQPTRVGCGAGRDAECCIYLVIGPEGLECQRFGRLRFNILMRVGAMHAQRQPTALYPGCLLPQPGKE